MMSASPKNQGRPVHGSLAELRQLTVQLILRRLGEMPPDEFAAAAWEILDSADRVEHDRGRFPGLICDIGERLVERLRYASNEQRTLTDKAIAAILDVPESFDIGASFEKALDDATEEQQALAGIAVAAILYTPDQPEE